MYHQIGMRHYDERTLELHLLKAPEAEPLRVEIARHLEGCAGCREVHAALAEYHAAAAELADAQERRATEAVVIRAVGVEEPHWTSGAAPARRLPARARVLLFLLRRPVVSAVSFAGLTALLAFGISLVRLPADPRPAHLRAENGALVVMDREGRELWRRYLGPELTADRLTDDMRPLVALRDVDGAPGAEVLIAGGPFRDGPGRNVLLCLGPDGQEKWRYTLHRRMVFGSESFADTYSVPNVWAEDFDRDGAVEVVALARTLLYYPCVVVTLDGRSGGFRGEYWHSGALESGMAFDIDRTPGVELLLVGENNGFNRAVAVAVEPARITGHSPAPPGYRPNGVPAGNEAAYLLFPPSDLNTVSRLRPACRGIVAEGAGSIIIPTRELDGDRPLEMLYHLDAALSCWKVVPNDLHLAEHRRLLAEGKLTREPDAAYFEELRRGVRYWNGREFVTWGEWSGRITSK